MTQRFTWVYIIRDRDDRRCKIGQSEDPLSRLRQLAKQPTLMSRPWKLDLVVAWWVPGFWEKKLHRMFADVRGRGEWFRLNNSEIGALREWFHHFELHPDSSNSDRKWSPNYESSMSANEKFVAEWLFGNINRRING